MVPSPQPMPSRRTHRRRTGAVASLALVLGLAGVAAVATPASAKGSAPVKLQGKVNNKGTGTIKNGKVEVEQDNYYFNKTFLKGSPGTVTIELHNEGNTEHSFTIDDQNIDEVVQPGKKAEVTVTLTVGQPANFYCRFHKSFGMQGALFTVGTTATSTG